MHPIAPRGQVLVIVALGLIVIVSMVGLVIDGGYAWTRQRDTQNGADAVAKAGTIVIQQELAYPGTQTDGAVGCAVDQAAAANGVVVESAEYTDFQGQPIGATVAACGGAASAIPTGAQGVKARTSETFDTFLVSVIGVQTLTAEADAIAVVGTLESMGGALPITFPQTANICDRDNPVQFTIRPDDGDGTFEPYEILNPETTPLNASNLAMVPLCDTAPGSVGWLDWDCGQNLSASIQDPCDIFIPIPAWVHTQTGNVNALEAEVNAYAGPANEVGVATGDDSVLALPIHDGTCASDVADNLPPSACPDGLWSGNGNNLYYHIPFWVGFKIDQAYMQGGDTECRQAPGTPLLITPDPPGKVGCLKGWFVAMYESPGSIGIGEIPAGSDLPLAVTLIN